FQDFAGGCQGLRGHFIVAPWIGCVLSRQVGHGGGGPVMGGARMGCTTLDLDLGRLYLRRAGW
ncbi:MAG: hypothetical protein R3303_07855, partial [Marinobacter sp.]|nr:hypothetical protein [Marinobacter sp.]